MKLSEAKVRFKRAYNNNRKRAWGLEAKHVPGYAKISAEVEKELQEILNKPEVKELIKRYKEIDVEIRKLNEEQTEVYNKLDDKHNLHVHYRFGKEDTYTIMRSKHLDVLDFCKFILEEALNCKDVKDIRAYAHQLWSDKEVSEIFREDTYTQQLKEMYAPKGIREDEQNGIIIG